MTRGLGGVVTTVELLGRGADRLVGSSRSETIFALRGDSVRLGGGNDVLYAGPGAGPRSWLKADLGPGRDIFESSLGGFSLAAGGGDDLVVLLSGARGVVHAQNGHDQVRLRQGARASVHGGGGVFHDRLEFDGRWSRGVRVDLARGTLTTTTSTTRVSGFDDIEGTSRADVLRGSSSHNALWGRGGDDRLYAGSGNDQLFGGSGDDLLVGGLGNDHGQGQGGRDRCVSVEIQIRCS